MGYSNWSDAAFRSVSTARAGASSAEIFRGERSVDPLMDPKRLRVREARDSEHHPNSVPIIVGFDVTGSMGDIPTRFAQHELGALMAMIVENGWVTDPQLLFAAIGDAASDQAPLQVGQFESGLEMDMWLTRIWLESNGGDAPESYTLAHWFAAHHTSTDAWEKRKRKGYLFTIGDAENKPLEAAHITRVFGKPPTDVTFDAAVIQAAAERYELFHVLVTRGAWPEELIKYWKKLVGGRLLVLDQIEAICPLIGVALGVTEGSLKIADAKARLVAAGMSEQAIAQAVKALS